VSGFPPFWFSPSSARWRGTPSLRTCTTGLGAGKNAGLDADVAKDLAEPICRDDETARLGGVASLESITLEVLASVERS
jgi:hypothetical protein